MNSATFIHQLKVLIKKSPRLFSTSRDNENCHFTDMIAYSKNAYYCFTGAWLEDCYYSEFILKSKDCVDCLKIQQCELCYECTECYQCYNSNYCLNCRLTRDSEYSYGLSDCHDCFLSNNLRHKSYCFKNKQYSKNEYQKLVEEYKKHILRPQLYKEFLQICNKSIRIATNNINCENCLGNEISNSKNVYFGFDIANAEDFFYSEEGGYGKDCCDTFITTGELNYECYGATKNSYNCNFCIDLTTCVNCEFCMTGYDLKDCFGCVYLKGKQNYILNQPYKKEEYKKMIEKLKKELQETNQYNFEIMLQPA